MVLIGEMLVIEKEHLWVFMAIVFTGYVVSRKMRHDN